MVLLVISDISAQPKREFRSVWLATNYQLDWPPKNIYDESLQKSALITILDDLYKRKFNTIFFQVRSQGSVFYKSSYEPFSPFLTGVLGKQPTYDPLDFLLEEAHKRNIEVHAWLNIYNSLTGENLPLTTEIPHVILQHPEWHHKIVTIDEATEKINAEYWIDPGIPETIEFFKNIVTELVNNYKIDGIQLDYCRYPSKVFSDEETYTKYGNGIKIDDWRRNNINALVYALYEKAIELNPFIKIGSAPLGIYQNIGKVRGLESRNDVYQDSRNWLLNSKQDYLAPQIYWAINSNQDFETIVRDWKNSTFNKPVIIGIGAYKNNIGINLPKYIEIIRQYKLSGVSFYRYENIKNSKIDAFRFFANIPALNSKDNIAPLPPTNINCSILNSSPIELNITWQAPASASDGDQAKYFNLYRSFNKYINRENPQNILCITRETAFFDKIFRPQNLAVYYMVTAFDKCNNESTQPSKIIKVELNDLKEFLRPSLISGITFLDVKESGEKYYFIFDNQTEQNLSISLFDGDEAFLTSIYNGILKSGNNIFSFDSDYRKQKNKLIIKTTTGKTVIAF